MPRTRVLLIIAVLVVVAACSGLRQTRFKVTTPEGGEPGGVASAIEPSLIEMGFKELGSTDRFRRWSGVGRVEVELKPKDDKVVVTVSDHFTGWSWPSPEYRSTRKRMKVVLRARFGERNVTIDD